MRCLFVSLTVFALACGGAVGPIDPATLHVEGSYDLVVSTIVGEPTPDPSNPPNVGHPGIGQHARLDVKKSGTSYLASVTPEFGDSVPMTVSFGADGTMTLEGSVSFATGNTNYGGVSDELGALHLAVGNDGRFSGVFTAEGETNIFEGDVGWTAQTTATGTTSADVRPPTAQISPLVSAPTVLLPWDALYARLSEPIDGAAFSGALSLTPGAVSWQLDPTQVDWLGATAALGYRTSWSDFSGDATLNVAAGLVDPSGNVSAATTTPVHFLDVPSAATFDGANPPAMWGAVAAATGSESCGQAGSCFEIGPIDGPCNTQPGGIAGRLAAGGASNLSITFRVRAASQYGQPQWPFGLGISVATPGSAAQLLSSQLPLPTMNTTSDATYPYASDWITTTIPLPQTGNEVGFSFVPFANAQSYCGGELGFVPVTLLVDVAQVTTAP